VAPKVDPVQSDEVLPAHADVVIIGGGIIGTSAALFLAQKGIRAVLCEKGHIAGEQSSRNWGWCRKMGRDPRELPLIIESMRRWAGLNEATGGETGFRQSGLTLPLTLSPGQTAAFIATFAPQTAGPASGSIQITSNASNSSVAVALSGSGSTIQHSVDVSWDASTPAASGYNVYRATQSGGPFTKLNAAPITVSTAVSP